MRLGIYLIETVARTHGCFKSLLMVIAVYNVNETLMCYQCFKSFPPRIDP